MHKLLKMLLLISTLSGHWMQINDLQYEEFVYIPFSYIHFKNNVEKVILYDSNANFFLDGKYEDVSMQMIFTGFSLQFIQFENQVLKVKLLYEDSEKHTPTYLYFMKLEPTENKTHFYLENREKKILNDQYDLTKMFSTYFLQKKVKIDNTKKTTIDYPIFNLSFKAITYYDLATKKVTTMEIDLVD